MVKIIKIITQIQQFRYVKISVCVILSYESNLSNNETNLNPTYQ